MEDEVIRVVVEQADKAGFPDYALTIFITVLSGVLVFAISEWLKEIWLTPLQNYKKLRGKVSRSLTMYACYYHNPVDIADHDDKLPDDYKAAAEGLRMLASELRAFIETLSWCKFGIPSKGDLYDASAHLIGLSNSMMVPYNSHFDRRLDNTIENENRVKRLLRIYKYEVTTK